MFTRKTIRHTGSFVATGQGGRRHTLHVFTTFLDASSTENPNAEIEGLKQIQTANGQHVNRLAQGEYEIVVTGELLRSADPHAP